MLRSTSTVIHPWCLLLPACLALACQDLEDTSTTPEPEASTTEPEASTTEPESGSTGDTTDEPTTGMTTGVGEDPFVEGEGVDIVFIVDNSHDSMATEKLVEDGPRDMMTTQVLLASGFKDMVAALDAAGTDYRVAITTTDMGGPRCPEVFNIAEAGRFQITSCRERDGDFQTDNADYRSRCADACAHATIPIKPTAVGGQDGLAPRPWLEKIGGATNVEIPIDEAAACIFLQGVAGCEWEGPLEASHAALAGLTAPEFDPGHHNQYFLRPGAHLLIVVVSDAADCSYTDEGEESLFAEGGAYWNSGSPLPYSDVCWKAAATCSGGPTVFDECHAEDHGPDAMPTDDPAQAVLFPLSRYTQLLAQLQQDKADAGSSGRVFVAAVAGVPVGYVAGGEVPYAVDPDPTYQMFYGIGPSCEVDGSLARRGRPPVRIQEVVEGGHGLGEGLYSLCDPGLAGLPAALVGLLQP